MMKSLIPAFGAILLSAISKAEETFTTYSSNFSIYAGVPIEFGKDTPAPIPGQYAALNWTFTTQRSCDPDQCGVMPNSGPYQAAYILKGDDANDTTATTTTSFSCAFIGSKAAYFDIVSAWVGCGAVQQYQSSQLRGPGNCDLTFMAYTSEKDDEPVETQVVWYRSNAMFTQRGIPYGTAMAAKFLPKFKRIRKVVVKARLVSSGDAQRPYLSAPSIYLDDVTYRIPDVTNGTDGTDQRF